MTVAQLFDLTGKVAMVTGARRGLGQAMALALADAGADIVGVGPNPMDGTAREVEARNRGFTGIAADLAVPNDFAEIVGKAVAASGRVDILVNNAGIIRRTDVLDFAETDWDEVMQVNLKSAFFLSQAVARHMVERGAAGRIVNIASILSFQGGVRVPSYTASKHGIVGLTRLLANELAPHGITVNAIAPGYMETDNTEALRNDADRSRQLIERIPLGRFGRAEELATALLFLAAPASGYVTGSVVTVDGGWMAR
ncbi:MAG: 2-dehydro-3-deoxy-D-gluconate 5-dehydrogenase KduD [Bauldia sp.]|uniref:2-dehydro-3-deoxy-D-gluconate 5-dehydrogenase KduD n=1 Tax=Bauldia sp. TaxID=2575872 RepID=UPI001D765DE6|nr:2-dehydro-3-deoxy-D-gluconate 5-dehydrogenase KduD [Bauldia sp.]MCB1494977.1 2-dehydro-3-deoxy-D-gluconate 5-dehydrogenase KduD [Bauldia sp.]